MPVAEQKLPVAEIVPQADIRSRDLFVVAPPPLLVDKTSTDSATASSGSLGDS